MVCTTIYVQIFEAHNFRGVLQTFRGKNFRRSRVSSIRCSKISRAYKDPRKARKLRASKIWTYTGMRVFVLSLLLLFVSYRN